MAKVVHMNRHCYSSSTMKAREWLARAERLLTEYPHAWLRAEFERIRQKREAGRLRVEGEQFIVEGTHLPKGYEAKEALESFLIRKAREQTGNNLTRAGELRGTTRVPSRRRRNSTASEVLSSTSRDCPEDLSGRRGKNLLA